MNNKILLFEITKKSSAALNRWTLKRSPPLKSCFDERIQQIFTHDWPLVITKSFFLYIKNQLTRPLRGLREPWSKIMTVLMMLNLFDSAIREWSVTFLFYNKELILICCRKKILIYNIVLFSVFFTYIKRKFNKPSINFPAYYQNDNSVLEKRIENISIQYRLNFSSCGHYLLLHI